MTCKRCYHYGKQQDCTQCGMLDYMVQTNTLWVEAISKLFLKAKEPSVHNASVAFVDRDRRQVSPSSAVTPAEVANTKAMLPHPLPSGRLTLERDSVGIAEPSEGSPGDESPVNCRDGVVGHMVGVSKDAPDPVVVKGSAGCIFTGSAEIVGHEPGPNFGVGSVGNNPPPIFWVHYIQEFHDTVDLRGVVNKMPGQPGLVVTLAKYKLRTGPNGGEPFKDLAQGGHLVLETHIDGRFLAVLGNGVKISHVTQEDNLFRAEFCNDL